MLYGRIYNPKSIKTGNLGLGLLTCMLYGLFIHQKAYGQVTWGYLHVCFLDFLMLKTHTGQQPANPLLISRMCLSYYFKLENKFYIKIYEASLYFHSQKL